MPKLIVLRKPNLRSEAEALRELRASLDQMTRIYESRFAGLMARSLSESGLSGAVTVAGAVRTDDGHVAVKLKLSD